MIPKFLKYKDFIRVNVCNISHYKTYKNYNYGNDFVLVFYMDNSVSTQIVWEFESEEEMVRVLSEVENQMTNDKILVNF